MCTTKVKKIRNGSCHEWPIILFIIWSRFVKSKPFSSQSTGTNTNLFVIISDLVLFVNVFLNYVLMRISEFKPV